MMASLQLLAVLQNPALDGDQVTLRAAERDTELSPS